MPQKVPEGLLKHKYWSPSSNFCFSGAEAGPEMCVFNKVRQVSLVLETQLRITQKVPFWANTTGGKNAQMWLGFAPKQTLGVDTE